MTGIRVSRFLGTLLAGSQLQISITWRNVMRKSVTGRLTAIAAAVGLALGSGAAFAQFDDPPPAGDRPQAQQPERDRPIDADQQQRSSELGERAREEERLSADRDFSAQTGDIDRVARENPDLSTFVEAVKAAGMEGSLTGGTKYTVFAPTNQAFEAENINELLEADNRQELIDLLRAHIVADDVDHEMARNLDAALTIDGGTVQISTDEDRFMVGNATVIDGSDIELGSLRVYAVDAVLSANVLRDSETSQLR
jgi:uncharacterized surface protein with fasciclin (FAS1) repeats